MPTGGAQRGVGPLEADGPWRLPPMSPSIMWLTERIGDLAQARLDGSSYAQVEEVIVGGCICYILTEVSH